MDVSGRLQGYHEGIALSPRKACAVARYLNSPVECVHVNLAKGEKAIQRWHARLQELPAWREPFPG